MTRTTGHLKWDEYIRLIDCLDEDNRELLRRCSLLCGFLALRINEAQKLRWKDIINAGKYLPVIQSKTKKTRNIPIHHKIRHEINRIFMLKSNVTLNGFILEGKRSKGKAVTTSYLNTEIKKAIKKYNIEYYGNESTHLFRKTFGRYHFDEYCKEHNGDKHAAAIALVHLQGIFGHSRVETTITYLGITQEEIDKVFASLPATFGLKRTA